VTNAEFTKTLGRALSRPTLFPIPEFGARLAFGEMADALLLSSQRVKPTVLEEHGFQFTWPTLESALRNILATDKRR
jgi:NAD dependent epimerase/dehydratase family enzyme